MTLNKDLFGNVMPEKPAEVPVSVRKSNKIRVYHASWEPIPPHKKFGNVIYQPTDNLHPNIIHAGTPESTKHRTHVHEYEIDLNHPKVSPITWGDAEIMLQQDKEYEQKARKEPEHWSYGSRLDIFNKGMSGKKEGLFENTPADILRGARRGIVLPYRNRREDAGSVSYAIPKSSIGRSVRYIGVHEGEEFRKQNVYGKGT